ncbi:MAG: SDR family NAD(P)-dependent oxidoreductase [Spirochaetaceae bacterium]|nr:SDR family NAD(P)-dependent oxidoreductase [Spirochaetaceae bacterium]
MQVWPSGLGQGIAKAVLKKGGNVVVTARDRSRVLHFEEEYPDRALAVSLELALPDAGKKAVEAAVSRFGQVDILVNNAGHGYRAAIEESEPEKIRQLFEEDFFGPMELVRLVLPRMREKKKGLVINVTSIGAVRGALGNGYYSAAKGALELATEALQKEVESFGIRTMLVEPGAMRTGFYGSRMEGTGTRLTAYDGIAEAYRRELVRDQHDQLGDPDTCGEILVETALDEHAPFRLLLGSDAVRAAKQTLQDRLEELEKWKKTSIQTDFS